MGVFLIYQFINGLKRSGVVLDRRVLSDLAIHDKLAFEQLVNKARVEFDKVAAEIKENNATRDQKVKDEMADRAKAREAREAAKKAARALLNA